MTAHDHDMRIRVTGLLAAERAAAAAQAASRALELGIVFPGGPDLQRALARLLARAPTQAPLLRLSRTFAELATWLAAHGERDDAARAERLASWLREEADARPL